MLTTMDEEVLELCTRTVTSTPITSPATGLDMMELLLKNCPATFPEKQTHGHVMGVRWVLSNRSLRSRPAGRRYQPPDFHLGHLASSGFSPVLL